MQLNFNEKQELFVLKDPSSGRYSLGRGWTTQKAYAKTYCKSAAEMKIKEIFSASGVILKIEPAKG
jgi:hypothetical protein